MICYSFKFELQIYVFFLILDVFFSKKAKKEPIFYDFLA